MNEVLIYSITWTNLENTMSNEKNPVAKELKVYDCIYTNCAEEANL